MRWVRRFVPELEKRWNRFVRKAVRSWRVDETYVKIRGEWTYRALCALAQFDFFTRPALGLLAEAEAQTGSDRVGSGRVGSVGSSMRPPLISRRSLKRGSSQSKCSTQGSVW